LFNIDRVYSIEKEFGRIQKPFELSGILTLELMKKTAIKYLETSKMVRYTLYPEEVKKDKFAK